LIIIVSVFSKYSLFLSAEFNLESDQSLSLLMSKRILGGQDFPFFYWGQNYMGMAEIWFSLPLQYILGSELRIFLISQVLLSILISYLIYYSFLLIHKEVMGVIFSFLFAFGHPFLNKHLLNVSENFGFSLLIGVLGFYFIYQFNKVKDSNQLQKKILLFYGTTLGFSLYNREILLFIFPFVLLVSFKQISLNIFNFVILIFGTIIYVYQEKNLIPDNYKHLVLIGICGGLSTFSTFSYETFELIKQGMTVWALINIVVSCVLCTSIFFMFAK
jgi:CrcB protein